MSIPNRLLLAFGLVVALQSRCLAVIVYDETINGELSSDNTAPTDLTIFMPGANTVAGQVTDIGEGGFNFTADIFTFEIAAGQQLDTIFMTNFMTLPPSAAVFLALDDGPTFQFSSPEINDEFFPPNLALIMGGTVVGDANVGTDILDDLQDAVNLGNGSMFDVPLGPGQYTMYIQEDMTTSDYLLTFNVSSAAAVPEPSSLALSVLGFGLIARPRRKRKSRAS